jgi:preprotein translocase subunit SecA
VSIINKLFGDPNAKEVKKLEPVVQKVNALEDKVRQLDDEQIKQRYQEIRSEIQKSLENSKQIADKKLQRKKEIDILEPYLPEVFALAREAATRTIGQRHFDVQLIGGYVLHQGKISEMKTGEGKTLVATLAASLNALLGKGVHIVTVNDYLARRDAGWMGQIYNFLGLSVSTIIHEKALLYDPGFEDEHVLDNKTSHMREVSRKEAYLADITYGTNNEFGFDYLRDNMAQTLDQMVQRPLQFAIVDEVDSILIDEARTPLIISAPAEEATDKYYQFAGLVKQLAPEKDFLIDEKMKSASLTDEGISHMEKLLGIENIYEEYGIENVHHLEQALKAETLFKKDRDYVVKDGEIIIVDEFTGRLMFGRRYSEGLHQAIEAKEKVQIKQESITLATISFQNYFRLYNKLAGMTGTAVTEAEEFHKIYELNVVIIPTNKEMVRDDLSDVIYKNEQAKFLAVVAEIRERHTKGQPVLVGTVSIERNEILSDLLKRDGIKHEVLNAKNHEKEATIIAAAGQIKAVTVATNMAGRGTDIILGEGVKELGGLHIIGTERHESRRIDNQLRGRAGRQGDPGSSQFFVSLEDDLMRIFGSERVKTMMEKLGLPDDVPIQHSLISKSLEQAQKRVESQNFDVRKHLVEYDDVMNRQREYIYEKRRKALGSGSLRDEFIEIFANESEVIVRSQINYETGEVQKNKLAEIVKTIIPVSDKEIQMFNTGEPETTIENLRKIITEKYVEKEKQLGEQMARTLEHAIYLRTIDMLWVDHLDAMDRLREGIGLRGYGQKDPLVEYKNESYQMFQKLLSGIQSEVANIYFRAQITQNPPSEMAEGEVQKAEEEIQESRIKNQESSNRKGISEKRTTNTEQPGRTGRVGRNDPCPCGSGKKYKKCHGKNN